jgi:hypothetical protein
MQTLRQRLASYAMVLTFLQAALVFSAPIAACCQAGKTASVAQDEECCPAGSHAPGECPRHARSSGESRASCRLQCDAPHGLQFIAGISGVLPLDSAVLVPAADLGAVTIGASAVQLRSSGPTSPPPR